MMIPLSTRWTSKGGIVAHTAYPVPVRLVPLGGDACTDDDTEIGIEIAGLPVCRAWVHPEIVGPLSRSPAFTGEHTVALAIAEHELGLDLALGIVLPATDAPAGWEDAPPAELDETPMGTVLILAHGMMPAEEREYQDLPTEALRLMMLTLAGQMPGNERAAIEDLLEGL